MKRSFLAVAFVALAAIAITGCQFVVGVIVNPDFAVEGIVVDTDASGEITGITITFYNSGGGAENVDYAVYLSDDANINTAADFKVYEGTIDIEWRQTQEVSLSVTQMEAFVATQATPPPEGDVYYIGVFVDPDNRIEEGDETDNDFTVATPAQFGSRGPGFQVDINYTATALLNSSNPMIVLIFDESALYDDDTSRFGVFTIDQQGSHHFPLSGIPYDDPATTNFYMVFIYDSGNNWVPGFDQGPGDVWGSYNTAAAATGNVDFNLNDFSPIVVGGSYSITFGNPPAPPAGPNADAYEYDDTWAAARGEVMLPSWTEFHTFDYNGDEDWFYVWVPGYGTLDVETYSAGGSWDCDTYLELYDDVGAYMAVSDDDGGMGLYSWLMWNNPDPTGRMVYVRVYELYSDMGEYYLDVQTY